MISLFPPARRAVAALSLLAVAASCGDPASPANETTQDIEITNVFAAPGGAALSRIPEAAATSVQITKIRITVLGATGTTLFQKVYDVDPAQTKWTLPFTAPLGESIRIASELISVTGGVEKVEYSGQAGPLTLTPCTTACTPIPIQNYPGPLENLGVTSVTLSPDAPTVVEGQTTTLTAAVAPAGGNYTIAWSSLDPSVATVNDAGVVTGVAAGTARIRAAVASKADTVNVTVTVANTCAEAAYTIGSTVNGTWGAGDCTFATSGRKYDMFAVTLTQTTSFHAALTGPNGRRIQMRRAGTQDYVQVMASDAFMPPTVQPLRSGYVLPAGSYVIEVVTPDATTLGAYTLVTTTGLPTGCATVVFTWPGVTINGDINANDCASPVGSGKEDRFVILPNAGVRLAMSMTTSAFAPLVVFRDDREGPASPTLAYDIKSEVGEPAKVAYTTTFSGFHEIVVGNANAGGTGNYTLTVGTESTTNTCAAIPISLGNRQAVWESTDCAADGRLYDKYSFTATEQEAFRVSLVGDVATKSAGVFRNGVEVLDWSNATTANLNAAWVLEPGTYEFRVGAPASAAGKSYTLTSADISSVQCTNNGTSGNVTLPGQELGGSDCTFNGAYEDRLVLYVAAGKTVEVTMNGTTVAPRAIIRDPAMAPGTVWVMQTSTTPGTVTTSYTTSATQYVQVIFSTNAAGQTGSYSGTIVVR